MRLFKVSRLLHKFAFVLILAVSGPLLGQSVEIDKKLGAENAKIVEASMGLYPDERMTAYVKMVGNRLVSQLDNPQFEFEFHIADDPIPNAFAID